MPRSLSLTAGQVNALTTGNDTILYNAQSRDILLYGGANLESKITILEIDNITGDCLTLKYNGSPTNYINFALSNAGTFNVNVNGGNKKFNLVNHDGSTNGLSLAGTLVTSSADQLNTVNTTPGTAEANKAIILDGNLDIVGIHNIETDNLTVNGTLVTASATELNYTDITSAGTAQASKALVVDINKDISGIRDLTATRNVNISNHDGSTIGLELSGTLITALASDINKLSTVTEGTVTASKVLIVDSNKDLASIRNLTSSGDLNLSNHDGGTTGLKLAGTLVTSSASEINKLTGVTPGTVTASKAVVVDSNKDLSSLRNLTVAGTVSGVTTLTTDNITLGSTAITATGAEINKLAGVTPGTASTNKTLVLNSSGNISGINSISTTSLIVNGVTISSGGGGSIGPDYTTGVTPGIANANSSLVLNADKEITGIVLLSSTTLGGTLSTAAQPNITSVGSLSGLTTAGLILGATTITATGSEINKLSGVTATTSEINKLSGVTATTSEINKLAGVTATTSEINKLAGVTATTSEINKLAGVTAGTVTASKALIVDANKDLSSLRNLTIGGTLDGVTTLTATTVDGTLSMAAQPNITSVGSLSGLTTMGITLGSTAITATGNEINKLSGVTASTSEINTLAGITAGTVAVSKALVVDSNKDLASLRNLTATGTVSANTLTGTLSTAAQLNITSVGSLSGLTTAGITLGATAITATAAEINILDGVTASTSEINTLAGVTATASEINTLAGITAGTVAVSKALVVDSNKDLASLRNLTATGTVSANTLTGTLSTAAQLNITSVGSLSGLTTAGITLGATAITATASEINTLDGITTTTSEINTLAGVTTGTVTASKALVVDSNKDLASLRNLTLTGTVSANTLAGSLSTAAQTAITSVGTLTSLTLSGSVSGVTTLGLSGIVTSTNSTASTSNTTGSLKLAGGIGISDATDAISNTNGGTFTSSGGGAFAKSLFVGTELTVGGSTRISNGYIYAQRSIGAGSFVGGWSSTNLFGIGPDSSATDSTIRLGICDNTGTWTGFSNVKCGSIISTTTTTSTSNITGALILSGGVGISDTTDAISNTNGGTFTSAGGGAFAKSLYVGTNLTVGGNLTISGITTSINSSVVNINDNMILLNSGPSGTGFDSGFNSQRYQISNGAGTGDVVNDIAKATATLAATASGTALTLPTSLSIGTTSAVNDFYNNWWVKVTSGSGNNQVRKIVSYVGSTRVATLDSTLTTSLAISDTISLYNKPYTSMVWQEANKTFISAYTASDVTGGALTITDYADIKSYNINATNTFNVVRTSNGWPFVSVNGTSTLGLYHYNNGDVFFGTTTANNLILQSNNAIRMTINGTTGDITGISALTATTLTASSINVNGKLTAVNSLPNTLAIESSSTSVLTNSSNTSDFDLYLKRNTGTTGDTTGIAFLQTVNVPESSLPSASIICYRVALSAGNLAFNTTQVERLRISSDGIISMSKILESTTNSTGALTLAGGIGISNTTDAVSSTNGGTFTSAGGGAFAKALFVGTTLTATTLSTTNFSLGGASVTSTAAQLNFLSGVTAGTAAASKALVLDSSLNITGISNLTTTGPITSTLDGNGFRHHSATSTTQLVSYISDSFDSGTAFFGTSTAQTFILQANGARRISMTPNSSVTIIGAIKTCVATINMSGLVVQGNTVTNNYTTASGTDSTVASNLTINANTLLATNASVTTTNAATLVISGPAIASTNMTITNAYSMYITTGTAFFGENISMNGTTFSSIQAGYLSGLTVGTAAASKALVLDSSSNISGINTITNTGVITTNINEPTSSVINYQVWSNVSGPNASISMSNAEVRFNITTSHLLRFRTNNTSRMIIEATGAVDIQTGLKLAGTSVTSTATELNYVSGVTAGTAVASKALVLDSSSNITGINNLSMGGTLTVGTSGSADNLIKFKGVTGDTPDNFTVISERLYNGSDNAELLLFKGNDTTDRVRIRAGNFAFQPTGAAETFSTLADNNTYLYIQNSGKVSVGSNSVSNDTAFGVLDGNNGTGVSMRFGNNLSTNNCMTMTWNPSGGAGSSNNTLNFNPYGYSNALVIRCDGNVGIGVASPGNKLEVNGNVNVTNGSITASSIVSGDRIRGNAGNTAAAIIGKWDDADWWGIGEHGSTNGVRIGICDGNGAWLNTYPSLVSGGYTNASDYRIKNTITSLSNVLNKIMELRPVSYYLNQDVNKLKLNIGFIAHELQEQFPELVLGEKDGESHQGVNYAQLTSVLVKGIQEHQEIIKSLEEKNKNLEDRLKILEDMILNP